MPNTLFGRLLLSSLLVLTLFFGALGYTINQVSHKESLINKQKQLQLQNYILLSSTSIDNDRIQLPDELQENRFDEFESGLYGYIVDDEDNILWSSYSSHSLDIDKELLKPNSPSPGSAEFVETNHYYIYRYSVKWEVITDKPQLLTFNVLEDSAPNLAIIKNFQKKLSYWFLGIGLTLVMLLLFILRWGTKPLRQLASQLKQVESGESQRLEGHYPIELHGLANNLNDLIETERQQRERYHATLANLAHSLKTPLAVVRGQLESILGSSKNSDNLSTKATNECEKPVFYNEHTLIIEQTQRMDDIIKHQLQRAVVATPQKLVESHNVNTCIERITSALEKVYIEKAIIFILDIAEETIFKGDQRDLMEVLGNILDNASKACVHTVKVSASMKSNQTSIDIHDDGQGIPVHLRDTIIKRGQRADTHHVGQGIGLDVARDIINSYQGLFSISDSPLGGALIQIKFPTS